MSQQRTWLDHVERAGNRLPDPATLFFAATGLVMVLSALGASLGWQVHRADGEVVTPVNLLGGDALWWLLANLAANFIAFPPLGLVVVMLLGIAVAERSGLLPVLLRRLLAGAPRRLLVPATVFVGVESSLAVDAGYVVLPPLAAALFLAAGRSPLAGIAAVTAGVTCGFSANLLLTGLDPLLGGLSTAGARVLDPDYAVAVTANWWFMIASTCMLTVVGTAVTVWLVEPRLAAAPTPPAGEHGGLEAADSMDPSALAAEARGLRLAAIVGAGLLALMLLAVLLPGWPLAGIGARFPRWMEAIVPLLFVLFLGTGLAYGVGARTIRNDKDVVAMMAEAVRGLAPYIVLAFFAAQFIAVFNHSRLGEMFAILGGSWVAGLGLPAAPLALGFVVLVMLCNLLIGSASAKYALFAPVFVPLLMQAGISPELTQAAYRVGDSLTNGITPFNPYLVIILAFLRRHEPAAGLGTLIALMLPYTLVIAPLWAGLLGLWVLAGWPLGPGGPLAYIA